MTKEKSLDLSTLDTTAACDKGAEIELLHPVTNAPLGIFISVLGKDSTTFKEYLRQKINEDIRRSAMAKKAGKQEPMRLIEESESRGIELLVVCTLGWRTGDKSTITFKGNDLEFNVPNAKLLYESLSWIKEQVDNGLGDLENFMKS